MAASEEVLKLRQKRYTRKWYNANKERVAEYQRLYYLENKSKLNEYQQRYYLANKDKLANKAKAIRDAGIEALRHQAQQPNT